MKKFFEKVKPPRHAELVSASQIDVTEIPKQVRNNVKARVRRAFTLAEVLVTLMIIGVVAAITIPTLMNNINNNAMANQRKTAAAKIAEGFAQMRVAGALNETYADTMAFVNAMKKYFKINAVCKSTELTSCFNSTVTTSDGTTETANKISEMEDVENVVGLILSDGTSMLIKYDKDADKIEEGQIEKVGYVKEANGNLMYATYGDLIKYIFDVNSSKGPNALLKDIVGNLSVAKGVSFTCEPYYYGYYECTASNGAYCTDCPDATGENCGNCEIVIGGWDFCTLNSNNITGSTSTLPYCERYPEPGLWLYCSNCNDKANHCNSCTLEKYETGEICENADIDGNCLGSWEEY